MVIPRTSVGFRMRSQGDVHSSRRFDLTFLLGLGSCSFLVCILSCFVWRLVFVIFVLFVSFFRMNASSPKYQFPVLNVDLTLLVCI